MRVTLTLKSQFPHLAQFLNPKVNLDENLQYYMIIILLITTLSQ